jgi:hypothetical protein
MMNCFNFIFEYVTGISFRSAGSIKPFGILEYSTPVTFLLLPVTFIRNISEEERIITGHSGRAV